MKLKSLILSTALAALAGGASAEGIKVGMITTLSGGGAGPVSYTHLTLPTIYSV